MDITLASCDTVDYAKIDFGHTILAKIHLDTAHALVTDVTSFTTSKKKRLPPVDVG